MSAVTYDRLAVSSKAQFERILYFTMEQKAGEHATATLRGILTEEGSKFLAGRVAEEVVTVLDKKTSDEQNIFQGRIDIPWGCRYGRLRIPIAGSGLLTV